MKQAIAALVGVLFVPVAQAADAGAGALSGTVDIYSVAVADLEANITGFGSGDDDGDGYGARALVRPTERIAVTAEFQSASYDASDDFEQLRLGVGMGDASGVFVEYLDVQFGDANADGYGLRLRLGKNASPSVLVFGELGYVRLDGDLEKLAGWELGAGLGYSFTPQLAAFIDYRQTSLEGDEVGLDIDFNDIRLGGRFAFGGSE